MKKKIVAIFCLVLLVGLLLGICYYQKQVENEQIVGAGSAENAPEEIKALLYHGEEYPLKKHIETVLLIGTDNEGREASVPEGFDAFYNLNQADFLMLLVLNRDEETAEFLQINRDTMTDVPWLDVLGNYGGTNFEQLCLSFNSGSGGLDSCQNTVDAVSGLLFDAPIDYFVQIPVSEISAINDLAGGVTVTIQEDMTAADTAFTKGATVHLMGKQAETFIRSRMILEDNTNLARMARQRVYMEGLYSAVQESMANDPDFLLKLLEKLDGHLHTSFTGNQLLELLERLETYEVSPIRVPEGELHTGGEYYEFYMDEASLWENVRELYCKK